MTAQTILLILLTVLLGFGWYWPPEIRLRETASDVPLAVVGGEAAPLYADALSNDVLASLSAGESLMVLELRRLPLSGRHAGRPRRLRVPGLRGSLTATPVPENFRVLGYYMHDPAAPPGVPGTAHGHA